MMPGKCDKGWAQNRCYLKQLSYPVLQCGVRAHLLSQKGSTVKRDGSPCPCLPIITWSHQGPNFFPTQTLVTESHREEDPLEDV